MFKEGDKVRVLGIVDVDFPGSVGVVVRPSRIASTTKVEFNNGISHVFWNTDLELVTRVEIGDEISFDEVQKGDKLKVVTHEFAMLQTTIGVAHHKVKNHWLTEEGGGLVNNKLTNTITLLDRVRPLPETVGSIIEYQRATGKATAILTTGGDWVEVTEGSSLPVIVSGAVISKTRKWNLVRDGYSEVQD